MLVGPLYPDSPASTKAMKKGSGDLPPPDPVPIRKVGER
jgi:hypothetical protein